MSTPTPRPERSARARGAVLRWLIKWHRRLGITAVVFVILFALTGIALNHASWLGLDRVNVTAAPVLQLYGLEPAAPPVGYELGDGKWIGWVDGGLYLGDRRIAEDVGQPVGAIASGQLIAVADAQSLLLFLEDGRLVERAGRELLPGPVTRLARGANGDLVIESGGETHVASPDTLSWQRREADPSWSSPSPLPPPRREALLAAYRGEGLPLDRVLLDLHSGRLFGDWGAIAADILAFVFVLLGVSGLWMWLRTRR